MFGAFSRQNRGTSHGASPRDGISAPLCSIRRGGSQEVDQNERDEKRPGRWAGTGTEMAGTRGIPAAGADPISSRRGDQG
jgi:hypothetical protein